MSSISYNSLSGLQGDPLTYISQMATSGKRTLDSSSVSTRIIILLAFIVIMSLYYVLFSSLGNNGGGGASMDLQSLSKKIFIRKRSPAILELTNFLVRK